MLLLCLGVAAPLIAIGSFTLYKSYQTLRQEASRATTFQAAIAVRSLHQWTQTQLDTAGAIASLAALRGGKADATQKIFETALKAEKQWHDLALLKDGKLIAAAERGDEGVTARTSSVTLDPITKDFISAVEKDRSGSNFGLHPFTGLWRAFSARGLPGSRQRRASGLG